MPDKMDLITMVSKNTGIMRHDVDAVLTEVFSLIRQQVSVGNSVRVPEFGLFHVKIMKSRIANFLGGYARKEKNPMPMVIPARKVAHFKPSKKFVIQ